MVNRVILIGVVGRIEPLRTTSSQGQPVLDFTLVTRERWSVENEGEMHVEYHPCVLWGEDAQTAHRYLKEGRLVYLQGRLHTYNHQDELQRALRRSEVVVDEYRFLDPPQPEKRNEPCPP